MQFLLDETLNNLLLFCRYTCNVLLNKNCIAFGGNTDLFYFVLDEFSKINVILVFALWHIRIV